MLPSRGCLLITKETISRQPSSVVQDAEDSQEIDAGDNTHDEVQPIACQAKISGRSKHDGRRRKMLGVKRTMLWELWERGV
jgi:hypothetical protein